MSKSMAIARLPRFHRVSVPLPVVAGAATVVVALALGAAVVAWPPAFMVVAGTTVAAAIVAAAWARQAGAFLAVILLSPVYGFLFVRLQGLGVPASLLSDAGYWKEIAVLALLLRFAVTRRAHWTTVDTAAVLFLGVLGLFLLLPVGGGLFARLVAVRQDGAFLMLFLVARHLDFDEDVQRRLEQGILVTGAILAAGAIWNHFQPFVWSQFMGWLTAAHPAGHLTAITVEKIGGSSFVRAGSFLDNYLTLPYYLLVAFSAALSFVAMGVARPWHIAVLALTAAGVILTLTRSAILLLPLCVLLAVIAGRHRMRLVVLLGIGMVAVLAALDFVGLGQRLKLGFDLGDAGTQGHIHALQESVTRIVVNPLGYGLASAGNLSHRFAVPGGLINESWYFQLGTEVGVVGLLLYVVVVVLTLRELWRLAHAPFRPAIGAVCALFAVAAGGLVLHTLEDRSVAWALWGYAGLVSSRRWTGREAPEPGADRTVQ